MISSELQEKVWNLYDNLKVDENKRYIEALWFTFDRELFFIFSMEWDKQEREISEFQAIRANSTLEGNDEEYIVSDHSFWHYDSMHDDDTAQRNDEISPVFAEDIFEQICNHTHPVLPTKDVKLQLLDEEDDIYEWIIAVDYSRM